jgi:hypothetical protein
MPPRFLSGSTQAEQVVYFIVYYGEYDLADV